MNYKKSENIFAIVMLIAFFLPWVNIGGFITVAGYNIPNVLEGLGTFANALNKSGSKTEIPFYFYLVYLVPLLTIGIIILDLKGIETKRVSILAGALPILTLVYFLVKNGFEIYQVMGIGAYITVIASIGLILGALNVINFEKKNQNLE
jgi:hypothetical protein